jgi:hypothetical protein
MRQSDNHYAGRAIKLFIFRADPDTRCGLLLGERFSMRGMERMRFEAVHGELSPVASGDDVLQEAPSLFASPTEFLVPVFPMSNRSGDGRRKAVRRPSDYLKDRF